MQKVVTIRASQNDLEQVTAKFTSLGWRIVSITKGSEWGRVGTSYKWTIVLEVSENSADVDAIIEEIQFGSASKSCIKTIGLIIVVFVGIFALVAIAFAVA